MIQDLDQLPASVATEFRPPSSRHALVVPVINEGERFLAQLGRMRAAGISELVDVIVVDGGSTDGSMEHGRLADLGVQRLVVKLGPGRLSSQLRLGYAAAMAGNYAGVVTIDGNGKDSVESIPLFTAALDDGVDYAQASRYLPGGGAVNTPVVRDLAIRLVHAPVLSLAARRRFRDTTQGFRAYSRRYLEHPDVRPLRDVFTGYELLAYLTVRASRLGLRTLEIPTVRTYPATGAIPTKITAGGSVKLLGVLANTVLGRYDPK
jgi:glycosyltransferase involved in cell wall biosynthesis